MDTNKTKFIPDFDRITEFFYEIVDVMVASMQQVPRVEQYLFQMHESMPGNCLSYVKIQEEVVEKCKVRIKKVIEANTHGPIK